MSTNKVVRKVWVKTTPTSHGSKSYRVEKTLNTTEPVVGSWLTSDEVNFLIQDGVTVEITPFR